MQGRSFVSVSAASIELTESKDPKCFMIRSPYFEAFKDVPQALRVMCLIFFIFSSFWSRPPSRTPSWDSRPPKPSARAMASGCSKHSFRVQCGNGSGESFTSWSGATCVRVRSKVRPSACKTPISPSFILIKFLVYLLNAEVSDAMNVRSLEIPMTRGEPLQATTSSSGLSEQIIPNPHDPSHNLNAFSVASFRVMSPSL
mmetsp:Transcript_19281/g.47675  ORF Transcript_19281/g.47675 Transcript_19281/m.47675 type:complete len:200 (-) Transcript_19281:726-1325(-)